MVSILPSSDTVHGYSSNAPSVFDHTFLCIVDSVIWWLSVCNTGKGREPCDPSHFCLEVANDTFHGQFVKWIPECVALHHNDCSLNVAVSQVGLDDRVRAKVGAQWSPQNT